MLLSRQGRNLLVMITRRMRNRILNVTMVLLNGHRRTVMTSNLSLVEDEGTTGLTTRMGNTLR